MMNNLGLEDDIPIENRMLTNSIESAQTKVEARNFGIRMKIYSERSSPLSTLPRWP